jgi:diguanylate cyclase (GGDEF)-like protein
MVRERIHPDDREVMQSAINDVIERGGALQMECRIVREDGAERWIETYAQPAFDENGDIVHLFGTVSDISPRKEVEAQLAFLAQHDALTGLPNRTLLAERLAESIAAARRTGRNVAVVFLDLDDFKYINDTHGQAVGDRVIRACADRLLACTRPGDTVGRVGGDEFVVVLSDMDASSGAVHAVRRMRAALAEPFDLGDIELGLRASFGISCFPSDGDSPDQLIGFADMAMYRAKQSRRGDFVYFEQSLQDAATERLRLEHELHDAIRDGELVVYYQPVIDARSKRVSGVEALVRWPQQAAALKPPASFIPLAEETGLIVPLGEFVLREACRTVAELHRSGFPELRLAVNLSPRQLDDEALLETVRSALEATGMSPRLLDLEITESFLARDPMRAAMLLDELAALGIRIALDDFGTGYSALTFLRTFPVNVLKLDRSFVTEIEDDPTARAIASTIVALARTLKMHSLAEGVETYEQSRILAEMGCEAFQGYYFARAMPAAALRPFLGGEAARIAV